VAQIAPDSGPDHNTRTLADCVLAKDDFMLWRWQSGKENTPIVYDLLLAMGKRPGFACLSPNVREWDIVE
jgi:hypothetical protein